jgi:hypothetical protein
VPAPACLDEGGPVEIRRARPGFVSGTTRLRTGMRLTAAVVAWDTDSFQARSGRAPPPGPCIEIRPGASGELEAYL